MSNVNFDKCPNCGQQVHDRAPACPCCGRKIYVEHPGDLKGVKHEPLDLKPNRERENPPAE